MESLTLYALSTQRLGGGINSSQCQTLRQSRAQSHPGSPSGPVSGRHANLVAFLAKCASMSQMMCGRLLCHIPC